MCREQILGAEARSRVPDEFIAQLPDVANPPTLFMPLMALAQAVHAAQQGATSGLLSTAPHVSIDRWRDFLTRAWPRLFAWYKWMARTQAGQQPGSFRCAPQCCSRCAFRSPPSAEIPCGEPLMTSTELAARRWRGRNADIDQELNPKTFASGLDDYPRASNPSAQERHLDLRCWMAFATQSMLAIGAHPHTLGRNPQHQTSPMQAAASTGSDARRSTAGVQAMSSARLMLMCGTCDSRPRCFSTGSAYAHSTGTSRSRRLRTGALTRATCASQRLPLARCAIIRAPGHIAVQARHTVLEH